MKKIGLALAMLFLLCCFSYAAENEMTVTGKLTQAFAIGGETTGWTIKLDQPLKVEGEESNTTKIDICDIKVNQLYSCLCTKCGHSWTSKSKPSKCPSCGNRGVVYN